MKKAEYITELKNTLNKINRQSWTEIKMLENNEPADLTKEAGPEELETLNKAKYALLTVTEILGRI